MKKRIYLLMLISVFCLSLLSCDIDIGSSKTPTGEVTITPEVTPTEPVDVTPTLEPTTVEKVLPEFFGEEDLKVNLNNGKTFDPMSGLEVWANGSDISDLVI